MANYLLLIGIGLAAGVLAGLFGIGGGIVIVPALIYIMKLEVRDALGTSLAALIPPVGLLGAFEYYREGHMNMLYAAIIAGGMFVGAWFGAKAMLVLPADLPRRLYAAFMVLIGIRMFWK